MEELGAADATAAIARLEARLAGLEVQQEGLQKNSQGFVSAADAAQHGSLIVGSSGDAHRGACGVGDEGCDSAVQAAERSIVALVQRCGSVWDEHSLALASLRVRTDCQEQRLAAHAEHLESTMAAPLEALRGEVAQLRDHDHQEAESRLELLAQRVQVVVDTSEEIISDCRGRGQWVEEVEASLGLLAPHGGAAGEMSTLRHLNASPVHEQAGLRPEEGVTHEELCGVHMRLTTLEQRLEFLELERNPADLDQKADRLELVRMDAELRELSEPLRRLSQRVADNQAKTTAVEWRVEQLQAWYEQSRCSQPPSTTAADACRSRYQGT